MFHLFSFRMIHSRQVPTKPKHTTTAWKKEKNWTIPCSLWRLINIFTLVRVRKPLLGMLLQWSLKPSGASSEAGEGSKRTNLLHGRPFQFDESQASFFLKKNTHQTSGHEVFAHASFAPFMAWKSKLEQSTGNPWTTQGVTRRGAFSGSAPREKHEKQTKNTHFCSRKSQRTRKIFLPAVYELIPFCRMLFCGFWWQEVFGLKTNLFETSFLC